MRHSHRMATDSEVARSPHRFKRKQLALKHLEPQSCSTRTKAVTYETAFPAYSFSDHEWWAFFLVGMTRPTWGHLKSHIPTWGHLKSHVYSSLKYAWQQFTNKFNNCFGGDSLYLRSPTVFFLGFSWPFLHHVPKMPPNQCLALSTGPETMELVNFRLTCLKWHLPAGRRTQRFGLQSFFLPEIAAQQFKLGRWEIPHS